MNLERMNSLVGTEGYIAPETINDSFVSYQADYWSLGVILYQLLCGAMPFGIKDSADVDYTKPRYELDFPATKNLTEAAKDLISKLLVENPDHRLGKNSINEI